jgi:hypothetical protein
MWSAEEIALGAESGISHGAQPRQMHVPIAPGDAWKRPTARKIPLVHGVHTTHDDRQTSSRKKGQATERVQDKIVTIFGSS